MLLDKQNVQSAKVGIFLWVGRAFPAVTSSLKETVPNVTVMAAQNVQMKT